MSVKYLDTSWDFRQADTKPLTHGIHPYPAMMIPQVAARVIANYGSIGGKVFDPYCGTGTSLLEAKLAGMDVVGTDLNPLARLIAKVKTYPIEIERIDPWVSEFESSVFLKAFRPCRVPEILNVTNIDYWFSGPVQERLAAISEFIRQIQDEEVQDFFRVAFSWTIRQTSWTKNSEFKLVRMSPKQIDQFTPDPFVEMVDVLRRNRDAMAELSRLDLSHSGKASVHDFNTVFDIPTEILSHGSVDLVLTSPPYGDSRTTVAYGQYSRFSNQWLGFAAASSVDRMLMGGNGAVAQLECGIEELDETVLQIARDDEKRAKEVASFFHEYRQSIDNVSCVVRHGGHVCYVVGNRTVRGVQIPMDKITVRLFEDAGFEHVETIGRNIPNKRMPYANSPTNVAGVKSGTMKREYIVICRKADRHETVGIKTAASQAA